MKKKTVVAIILIVCIISSFPCSIAKSLEVNKLITDPNTINVYEKDMKTNVISKKSFTKNADGSTVSKTIDSWVDSTRGSSQNNNQTISEDEITAVFANSDPRTVVNNTTQFPYSAIVYLSISFDGLLNDKRGTGFLIGDNIVVTNAHCLYDQEYGWTTGIFVTPGKNGALSAPFGVSYMESGVVCADWLDNYYPRADWAVFKIYSTLIGNPGKFSFTTLGNTPNGVSSMLSGYPKYYGTPPILTYKQYKSTGLTYLESYYYITFTMYGSDGQSGSPILDGNNAVIGIFKGQDAISSSFYGIRITPIMYEYFSAYVEANEGS